jgi:hypothetical protein
VLDNEAKKFAHLTREDFSSVCLESKISLPRAFSFREGMKINFGCANFNLNDCNSAAGEGAARD